MNEQERQKNYFYAKVIGIPQAQVIKLGNNPFYYGREIIIKSEFGEDLATISSFLIDSTGIQEIPKVTNFIRYATQEDRQQLKAKEKQAVPIRKITLSLIQEQNLPMNIVHIHLPLKGHHIVIYFTAKQRIDFRELLKSLRQHYSERITLRHISSQDRFDAFIADPRIPLDKFKHN